MSVHRQTMGSALQMSTSRFVIATLGAYLFAFDADAMRGSLVAEETGRTEGITAEGIWYKKIDLAGRMALPSDSNAPGGRMLLLVDGGRHGCIRAARLNGVIECEPNKVLPLSPHFQGAEREWYQGMILFDQSVAMVLNIAWILKEVGGGDDPAHLIGQPDALPPFADVESPGLALSKVQEC
ncbi:MAG: chemotaxis protein CheW [Nitrospira sp.]|nr:chemotaxis protein CheW [Nitrospira sp.]MDH5624600.1 chemotaxis protein CheW [Nitrospira sp.]